MLTPAQLADELERDLDILASQAGDTPERHRSLRAAFDGSWRLLDDEQRRALASLSAFAGPFDRNSAAEVAGASLPSLAALVDRSLIRRIGERYEIHDLIHRYSAEALEREGHGPAIRERHARVFSNHLVSRLPRLRSPQALAEVRPELADVRAAALWAVTHWSSNDAEPLLQGLTAIWALQVDPSGPATFRELARAVAEDRDPALDTGATVAMHTQLAGHLALSLASVDAESTSDAVVDKHLDAVRAGGDRWALAACYLARGMNQNNRDENTESLEPLKEADRLFAEVGDDLLRSDVLTWSGWAHLMRDEIELARRDFEEAYRLARGVGEPVLTAFALSKLGTPRRHRGTPTGCLAPSSRSLRQLRRWWQLRWRRLRPVPSQPQRLLPGRLPGRARLRAQGLRELQ